MKRVISIFGKQFHIPKTDKISTAIASLSLTEKVLISIFAIIFIWTSFSMLSKVSNHFTIEVPRSGGTLREGVIGTPRFINPLLALSDTDRDLTALIYSGLMRRDIDGNLIPDLAESYEISEDGITYFFTIKENAVFHDGEPVTADDVVFTVLSAQDSAIKSPKRATWDGVSVEVIDEKNLVFHLEQPYSPFLNNMTLGIMPKHLWQAVSSDEFSFSQLNNDAVGSGPYKIEKVIRDKSGIATSYVLESFDEFTLGKAYIKNIEFYFYRNEQSLISALENKEIDSLNGISPEKAVAFEDDHQIEQFPLPRIFAVFFNQSKAPVLINTNVRKILSGAISRKQLVEEIFAGYAREAYGPIPQNLSALDVVDNSIEKIDEKSQEELLNEARESLAEDGWELDEEGILKRKTKDGIEILSFSISTADVPELVSAAEYVVNVWRQIGVDVSVKVFNTNDLNQNVIRPRRYDALLFGEIIGHDLDFYAFWHSSQRNDPGLNIADYANITVDKALEKARELSNNDEKAEQIDIFEKEIKKEAPATFLYSPDFIYIVPRKLKGVESQSITIPAERFSNVYKWYTETDMVWKVFQ